MPQMHSVDSTSLDRIGYDAEARELYVRFRESQQVYIYSGVGPRNYGELLAADSKGAYLNQNIKGRFPYRRLGAAL